MSIKGPIILIEDDSNDLDIITSALKDNDVNNAIISFTNAKDAMEYLMVTTDMPFLILCDISMPGMNGLEFRKAVNLNEYLRKKSIPFLFYTAAVSQPIIDIAYDLTVQGFFKKPQKYEELKKQLHVIITYWSTCLHPNNFNG